ncbi:MAG: hypothetical protein CVU05_09835 [Bacteroidetes bacterium HGW-Bacteroidetes-21]|jgi:hypothetical protein|nr:MAG: hypothetical protein CVU05_09835 [Bacteroidetes bacterium HGW-Bacteroidetes-21]
MDNSFKEKGNAIAFRIFPSLPDKIRYSIVVILMLAGFYIQFYAYEILVGGVLIFLASLLVMFKGIDKRVYNKGYTRLEEWTKADKSNILDILNLYKNLKRWDVSSFEVTSLSGCFIFGLILVVAFIFIAMQYSYTIIGVDILMMFFPLYLSGMAKIDTKPQIVLKIENTRIIEEKLLSQYKEHSYDYYIQMAKVAKVEKPVPRDIKIKISPPSANEDFLGIYGQCSINVVSGKFYPYLYYVIVFRSGFKLRPRVAKDLGIKGNICVEITETKEAEVLIIRQKTTKTSGYHTNAKAIAALLDYTLELYKLRFG